MIKTILTKPVSSISRERVCELLSTGWFQEWIRSRFHNQTWMNWGPDGRFDLNVKKAPLLNIIKNQNQNEEVEDVFSL